MASSKQLEKLFRAIGSRDWTAVDEVALAICGEIEAKGQLNSSRLLRGILRPNMSSVDGGGGGCNVLLPPSYATRIPTPDYFLSDLRVPKQQKSQISAFINESKYRDYLLQNGLEPRTKLLLCGPPGCGKSMAARCIGKELNLPVYLVHFHAIIGSLLGQTAVNIRQVFHFAESVPCVLLLDEIDAIGRRRGAEHEVGELDRIVIALLQELEHSKPRGVIVATSNLSQQLDEALWRRFELFLEFPRPSPTALLAYCAEFSKRNKIRISRQLSRQIASSDSYAVAKQKLEDEIRRELLRFIERSSGGKKN